MSGDARLGRDTPYLVGRPVEGPVGVSRGPDLFLSPPHPPYDATLRREWKERHLPAALVH